MTFKRWLTQEYLQNKEHRFNKLATDLNNKWKHFPDNADASTETLQELEFWLYVHEACAESQKNFKDSWEIYVNDIA